jgi:hypothetical protein
MGLGFFFGLASRSEGTKTRIGRTEKRSTIKQTRGIELTEFQIPRFSSLDELSWRCVKSNPEPLRAKHNTTIPNPR